MNYSEEELQTVVTARDVFSRHCATGMKQCYTPEVAKALGKNFMQFLREGATVEQLLALDDGRMDLVVAQTIARKRNGQQEFR